MIIQGDLNNMENEKYKNQIKYNAEHQKKMTFSFSKEYDKDILDYLDQVESKLGTIKQALREYMQNHK